jgi:hypothetical protein
MAAALVLCGGAARARGNDGQEEPATTIRGRVLNSVTKEPISRALVVLQDNNAAAFTDDRGQFELKIPEKRHSGEGIVLASAGTGLVEARKPGFLQQRQRPTRLYVPASRTDEQTEATIYLVPEAKIVGHVEVPGSEGDLRIQCQLYRRVMNGGRESWSPLRTFTTFVDGEFRFSELQAGTYKLITREQTDPDSTPAQLYAYPPRYYPNATDFSLASPIVVKAGETARVNLTVARQKYYPVKIALANMPVGRGVSLMVYPMGHRSPGWSLGYDTGEDAIEGSLPDGNYTVEASTQGEGEMTGLLNFSVKGEPMEGPTLTLVPDATVSVRVREEFQSGLSNFAAAQTIPENPPLDARRFANVHVNLMAIDELNPSRRNATSQLAEGSAGQELTIPNVRPGRYEVEVTSGVGYAASLQCGGKDLTHEPLVVGSGGAVALIEVVLRDDGAEVDGDLEEGSGGGNPEESRTLYLVPAGETGGPPRSMQAWQGQVTMQQVPPGDYVALAFAQRQDDLAYGTEEATQRLLNKGGKMIHLEPGQKVSVKVKVIGDDRE